jgi:hypothetical protein
MEHSAQNDIGEALEPQLSLQLLPADSAKTVPQEL